MATGLVFILVIVLAMGNGTFCEGAVPKHPAFFVFGDSLVDIGNNNFLATSARADSPPYGVDYPTHRPTGRFSNGLNIPDIISEEMGWEPVLPYLSPELTGKKLLLGANFASAGVGILNDTGIQFVNIIRVPQQVDYFEQYKERAKELIGEEETNKLIKEALVLVTLGGNDFVNNYFLLPISARATQFALQAFIPFLLSEYKKVLTRLYEVGVGKVLVTGIGPIGCAPAEMATRSINGECADDLQVASSLFDSHLVQMLDALNKELSTHIFIGANTNSINLEFITNPKAFGFTTSKMACCGQGPYNGVGFCTPVSSLCPNRDEYVFWDAYHPSERANRLIVKQILKGSSKYMHPMNLSTFMALETQNAMT